MNKLRLTVDGYKCFAEKHYFNLNNITLLTGANSAGKSSIIQTLLLAKILSETTAENGETEITPVSLMNKRYALELGGYDDIINRDTRTGDIYFSLEDIEYAVRADHNEEENAKNIHFSLSSEDKSELKKLFSNGFTYLCADRTAPHYEYQESGNNEICDCHGSNVGDVFSNHQGDNIKSSRSLSFKDNTKLLMQLDEWCDYIFPDMVIRVERTGSQMYKLKIRNDAATNVGFGITYALPVLVSGLTVPEGGMLIVENPEAHLHAKAQSNMGYFLARMAAAGVRVILETHSEHIVNGIRRMIVEGKTGMSHDDMTIYFFHNGDGRRPDILPITMDKNGNLSAFPENFFDQVRQDTLAILRIDRAKKEEKNEER